MARVKTDGQPKRGIFRRPKDPVRKVADIGEDGEGERFKIDGVEAARALNGGSMPTSEAPKQDGVQRRVRIQLPGAELPVYGNRLRELRERLGVSVGELAAKAYLPPQLVSNYEAATDGPDSENHRRQLAVALGVEPADAFPTSLNGQPVKRDELIAEGKITPNADPEAVQRRRELQAEMRMAQSARDEARLDEIGDQLRDLTERMELHSLRDDTARIRREADNPRPSRPHFETLNHATRKGNR